MSRFMFLFLFSSRSDKIAVVLSGCGVYDGAEVHESAACLAAITRQVGHVAPLPPPRPDFASFS